MTELRNRLGHWSAVKGRQDVACAESTAAGRLGSLGRPEQHKAIHAVSDHDVSVVSRTRAGHVATKDVLRYSPTVFSRWLKLLYR